MARDELRRLAEVFRRQGRRLFLVGGSVRDLLLGRPTHDFDLTTDAPPGEIKLLIRAALPEASIYTIGEKFGTIGAAVEGEKIEITTFRSEQYQPKSRKPAVEFGTTLEGDLARRDFTINALAQDLEAGEIVDSFGGLGDLRRGLIRAVGSPTERFAEDPLRLLRAVRFAAELGFEIDSETARAIAACADQLEHISKERIAEEFNRILVSPRAGSAIRLLDGLGLLAQIVPELLEMKGMTEVGRRYKDIFAHTLTVVDRIPPVLHLRWAALLHDIAKPRTLGWDDGQAHFRGHERLGESMARRILGRLRLDNATTDRVTAIVAMHSRINYYTGDWTDSAIRRLIREAGDLLDDLFTFSQADLTTARAQRAAAAHARLDELQQRAHTLIELENVPKLESPLDGHELMALFGRGPGPWIKPVKDFLLDLVLEGDLAPDDKERAAELARKFVAEREI